MRHAMSLPAVFNSELCTEKVPLILLFVVVVDVSYQLSASDMTGRGGSGVVTVVVWNWDRCATARRTAATRSTPPATRTPPTARQTPSRPRYNNVIGHSLFIRISGVAASWNGGGGGGRGRGGDKATKMYRKTLCRQGKGGNSLQIVQFTLSFKSCHVSYH